MTNFIEQKKQEARDEFIKKYCVKRPAQEIRWIRSVFYDEEDKINTIICELERNTKTTIKDTLQMVLDSEEMKVIEPRIENDVFLKMRNQAITAIKERINQLMQ